MISCRDDYFDLIMVNNSNNILLCVIYNDYIVEYIYTPGYHTIPYVYYHINII